MNIHSHYADLLNATYESILFADCSGVIQFWNPGCERIFGFSSDEAIGKSLDIIIPERLRKAHWKGFFEAVERGDTLPGRRPARTKALSRDGGIIYVEMSFAMAHDAAGAVIGSVAVARPDQNRKESEEAQATTENSCPFST
jgi:PAS domain S-box-containing protein